MKFSCEIQLFSRGLARSGKRGFLETVRQNHKDGLKLWGI